VEEFLAGVAGNYGAFGVAHALRVGGVLCLAAEVFDELGTRHGGISDLRIAISDLVDREDNNKENSL